MLLISLYRLHRLYKLAQLFFAPLGIYLRLAISKVLPEEQKPRLQLQRGQGLVEYALVLVLVAVVVIAILTLLGPQVTRVFFIVQCSLSSGDVIELGNDVRCDAADGTLLGYFDGEDGRVIWP